MSVVGYQDFWVAGSRFYFKRENTSAGVERPITDLGVIEAASPNFETEAIQLEDSDGGTASIVDEALRSIDESYTITLRSFSPVNLALLFASNEPAAFTQTVVDKDVQHYAHAGKMLKIHDDDTSKTWLYKLESVGGVYTGDVTEDTSVTAVTVATNTITLGSDLSSDLSPGDAFILAAEGLTDVLAAGTYTVASVTSTTIVTEEQIPGADQSTLTGTSLFYVASGDTGTVYEGGGVDWEVVSLDRGLIRMVDGGAFSADANVQVVFSTDTISGDRLILPQSVSGIIKGDAMLVWGRNNNAEQSVREALVSITPANANVQDEDFSSFDLTARVLSDSTRTNAFGRLLQPKGSIPTPG